MHIGVDCTVPAWFRYVYDHFRYIISDVISNITYIQVVEGLKKMIPYDEAPREMVNSSLYIITGIVHIITESVVYIWAVQET